MCETVQPKRSQIALHGTMIGLVLFAYPVLSTQSLGEIDVDEQNAMVRSWLTAGEQRE